MGRKTVGNDLDNAWIVPPPSISRKLLRITPRRVAAYTGSNNSSTFGILASQWSVALQAFHGARIPHSALLNLACTSETSDTLQDAGCRMHVSYMNKNMLLRIPCGSGTATVTCSPATAALTSARRRPCGLADSSWSTCACRCQLLSFLRMLG